MWFTALVFFFALIGLVALFELKHRENVRGHVYAFAWRARADEKARVIKRQLILSLIELEKLPLIGLLWLRHAVHGFAVWLAEAARSAESAAHALANIASHQRQFEVRETRSEFLKQVIPPGSAPNVPGKEGHDAENGGKAGAVHWRPEQPVPISGYSEAEEMLATPADPLALPPLVRESRKGAAKKKRARKKKTQESSAAGE